MQENMWGRKNIFQPFDFWTQKRNHDRCLQKETRCEKSFEGIPGKNKNLGRASFFLRTGFKVYDANARKDRFI